MAAQVNGDDNDRQITLIDDQGNEKEFEVLFTFNNEELGKQYVLYYDTTVEEPSVFASIYDDAGQLFPIETPEEWEMVEEMTENCTTDLEKALVVHDLSLIHI